MSKESRFPNKDLLVWISANILGFAALGVLILAFPSLMSISGFVPTYLIISIPIGLAQWLALRHILRTSVLWVFTVPVGVLFAALIFRIAPYGLWLNLGDESLLALTSGYRILACAYNGFDQPIRNSLSNCCGVYLSHHYWTDPFLVDCV